MEISYQATSNQALHTQKGTDKFQRRWWKKERISQRHTFKNNTDTKNTRTPRKHVLMNGNKTPTCPCINWNANRFTVWLLTSHAGVSTEAAVQLTVDQSGVEKPLAKQVENAVDLGSCWGRQRPRFPTALIWAGEKGRRGRSLLLLLLLLLGCFGWLTTTALQGGEG